MGLKSEEGSQQLTLWWAKATGKATTGKQDDFQRKTHAVK